MKTINSGRALVLSLAFMLTAPCVAQDERFDIVRFQVEGNTLLPEAEVQRIIAPLVGPKRVYGDIQKALEALEGAYRKAGFSTVQVFVPEQELTTGVVRLDVTEGVLGKVLVEGNRYFDTANVRAGLPALREGKAPNLRELSENIQLSNENPAKQVEVTLGVSEEEGKVDAKVAVTEENPQRAFMTLDGTGTAATGRSRMGVAYQNANLFKLDHTLTLAYTGSPDVPAGVKVDIFSIGYRVPLYRSGDSLDFIYGKSSVNTPSSSPTLGGALGIVGKGDVFGARWNHYFPRQGEYSSKLIYGIDYKYINARCSTGLPPSVTPVGIDPPTPLIASCVPYTTRPLSITYTGQKQSPGRSIEYTIGMAYNVALGSRYTNTAAAAGSEDRYSYLTSGNRPTSDDFTVLRLGGSYLKAMTSDWQVRIAASGQYAGNPLVAAEQFGLAGSTAVRGFTERAAASDSGYLANAEIYSPELAKMSGITGNLRALAFYDFARGFNNNIAGSTTPRAIGIASVGAGLRYTRGKDFSLRFDLAQVIDAGPPNTKARGDWRGHVNLMLGF
ncbi:MAG: ShlB/FhaC/HecB family hemolysin secretion/activation protein [Betaproteobacteria bacterium]|nr:MAG: ShlB/FhaC/HecB family hemolysin secretion/activation protein [Betaproteobacteria bacterium]